MAAGTTPPGPGPATGRHHAHWPWGLVSLVVLVVVVVLVLHGRSAQQDFVSAFRHVRLSSVPWLVVAAVAEAASLFFYACVHRRLLGEGGVQLGIRSLLALTVASTGIASLMPGGFVPASGWLVDQYRRREVPVSLGLWSVLAGGFSATVSVLGLLLTGAAIAGISNPVALLAAGAVLLGGSAGFIAVSHRLAPTGRPHSPREGRLAAALGHLRAVATEAARYRAGYRGGGAVLTYSTLNWLLDCAVLVIAFAFVGLPVPWRDVLFAYAASQAVAGLIPLPAGIGVVEGGLLGGFAITGVAAGSALAAVLVYRIVGYWLVGAVGSAVLIAVTHRRHRRGAAADGAYPDRGAGGTDTPGGSHPRAAESSRTVA